MSLSGWRVPPGGRGSKAPFRAGARTYRPTRAGKMFSPRALNEDCAGEAGTFRPYATVSRPAASAAARGPGKDLCPPGSSEARGRLRDTARRRTLTTPGSPARDPARLTTDIEVRLLPPRQLESSDVRAQGEVS